MTNPDTGITELPNNNNNNNNSSSHNNAGTIFTGAPAKKRNFEEKIRSQHMQRGENLIEIEEDQPIVQVQPYQEYVEKFGSYLDTLEYSDVRFVFNSNPSNDSSPSSQPIQAHKIVVATHSNALKSCIAASTSQDIELDRSYGDPRSFSACLNWMYRRELPSTSSGAVHLSNVMGCATALALDALPSMLFEKVQPLVCLTNVIQVVEIADFFQLENLLQVCIALCAKDMPDTAFEHMIQSMCTSAEASLLLSAEEEHKETNDGTNENDTENSYQVRELVLRLLHARTIAPMAMAVKYNLLSVVKTLLNCTNYYIPSTSDLLKKSDEDGARPLELALRLGHDSLVEPLVAAGDEMVVNQRASTPSRPFKRPGGTRADHFKLEAGEQTMLHLAAASGNAHHCRVLCDAGADVNAVNSTGRSPLHLAVLSGDLESLRLLLDRGVAPNLQDANGHTALHLVTGGDLPEDVLDVDLATFDDLELVSSGSVGEKGDQNGGPQNVQQMQQTNSQRQMMSPNRRNKSGEVLFHFSPLPLPQAERVVDMLLQTKINVHIPDGKGRTPLHVSVWRGALNITRRLLGAGADPVSN